MAGTILMERATMRTCGPPACPAGGVAGAATAAPVALSFEVVLERFGPEIYRFAMGLCRNRSDADDLYQETALKAYRAYDRLPVEANHRAWLYRIAGNTFLSERRKLGRVGSLDGTEAGAEAIPEKERDDAARLDARDLLEETERLVAKLPKKQRLAIIGRKYHDLSYAEIGELLGCSEAAARANVHEGLRKLREALGERLA
jgi:RNA polymerase sigma-70 factor (ECF subfamily)